MTSKKWSNLFGALVAVFTIAIPLAVVFGVYMSLETTTASKGLSILGVFLAIGILVGAVKLMKNRIKVKKEMGFEVSPYFVLTMHSLTPLISPALLTWFLWTIEDDVRQLKVVMFAISVCALIAFVLKFVQVRFDILVLREQNPQA